MPLPMPIAWWLVVLVVGMGWQAAADPLDAGGDGPAVARAEGGGETGAGSGRDEIGAAAAIGRQIFSDLSLSNPPGQGCISCHDPQAAFADPRVVSPGAVVGRQGRRNAPTLMYAALIPALSWDELLTEDGAESFAWEGGLFYDGRARDLFEQVQQPFYHRDEMNVADPAALAASLRRSGYSGEFRHWVGDVAWADDGQLDYHAYRALVEFLKEPLFRPFDARIDDYLGGDEGALDESERRGLEVFREAGKCADCHLLQSAGWPQPLLSDFGYDNLGAPQRGEKDPGLGGVTKVPGELGQFRAPTLRNIALTAPYMHNGSIASLREVIEFYNKRDLEPDRWGVTDYPQTVNHEDLGDLGLSDQQVGDLLALMGAFTDRNLLGLEKDQSFPPPPPGVPSTEKMKLMFPDWTHRLHPAFPREAGDR
jgi:cytochrome c peroxidase